MLNSSNGALPENQRSQHPLASTAKLQALNPANFQYPVGVKLASLFWDTGSDYCFSPFMNNYTMFCSLSKVLRAYISKSATPEQQIAANKPDKGQAELFRDASIYFSTWLLDQDLLY